MDNQWRAPVDYRPDMGVVVVWLGSHEYSRVSGSYESTGRWLAAYQMKVGLIQVWVDEHNGAPIETLGCYVTAFMRPTAPTALPVAKTTGG